MIDARNISRRKSIQDLQQREAESPLSEWVQMGKESLESFRSDQYTHTEIY
jgi:hypothetical protein